MNDVLLEQIIALEKQLQKQLVQEQERAAEWQKRELAILDQALVETESFSEEVNLAAQEQVRKDVQREGQTLLESADRQCVQLSGLEERLLRQVLTEQLQTIFPEVDHDHPNGQG
jgi:hypothetical protein